MSQELSPYQQSIYDLVCQDASPREIGAALGKTVKQIHSTMSTIRQKGFDCQTRHQRESGIYVEETGMGTTQPGWRLRCPSCREQGYVIMDHEHGVWTFHHSACDAGIRINPRAGRGDWPAILKQIRNACQHESSKAVAA